MTHPIDSKDRQQILFLLRCALADLQGSKQAYEQGDSSNHDWKAHTETINDIEVFFDNLGEPT